jgi:hypothetical protein
MARVDEPRAPYKVYEDAELKGTYPTRAEARRAQQQLEGEASGSEPQRHFIIKDDRFPPQREASAPSIPISRDCCIGPCFGVASSAESVETKRGELHEQGFRRRRAWPRPIGRRIC